MTIPAFYKVTLKGLLLFIMFFSSAPASAQVVQQVLDLTGSEENDIFGVPGNVVVDYKGNAYVTGFLTHNVFKIAPDGGIVEIIDSSGDGFGNILDTPRGLAVDSRQNVYVAGVESNNVFKISVNGTITEVMNETGDLNGNELLSPWTLESDIDDNIYVGALNSSNIFRITPDEKINVVMDSSGDGNGNELVGPGALSSGYYGNVYVLDYHNHNVFKIDKEGDVSLLFNIPGVRTGLSDQGDIVVSGAQFVYVTSSIQTRLFEITPSGEVSEFKGDFRDSAGNVLARPEYIETDILGNLYMTGKNSRNVFRLNLNGELLELADETGDGEHLMNGVSGLAVDRSGNVFVGGFNSANVFKISYPFPGAFNGEHIILPVVKVAGSYYQVELTLIDTDPATFRLTNAVPIKSPNILGMSVFRHGNLNIPQIYTQGLRFEMNFELIDTSPIKFVLHNSREITD